MQPCRVSFFSTTNEIAVRRTEVFVFLKRFTDDDFSALFIIVIIMVISAPDWRFSPKVITVAGDRQGRRNFTSQLLLVLGIRARF